MARYLKVIGAQQERHRLAELAERPVRQRIAAAPPVRPARLREIAAERRREADRRAHHLRPDADAAHRRWVELEITRLRAEADAFDAQAAALEATDGSL